MEKTIKIISFCHIALLAVLVTSCGKSNSETGEWTTEHAVNQESFYRIHKDMLGFSHPLVKESYYLELKKQADSIKCANHIALENNPPIEIDMPSYNFYAKYLPDLFDGWLSKRTSMLKLPVEYYHYYSFSWNDWKSDICSSLNDYIESSDLDENYRDLFCQPAIIVQAEYYVTDNVIQLVIDRELSDLWDEKFGELINIGSAAATIPYQLKIEKSIVSDLTMSYLNLFEY